MNYNDVNLKLIDAYKNAKKLITDDPNNKENIIRDYIDLVLKFNNYSQSYNNNMNNNINNPIPSDINIYNNFNTLPNNSMTGADNNKNKNYIDITKTSSRSIQELANTFNYINK